jgi:hypothetical protein
MSTSDPEPLRAILASISASTPLIPRPETVAFSEIVPEPVTWLWHGLIPRGKLTVLDGDPGLGKSTLTIDLTARITTGQSMPFSHAVSDPADVILSTTEDALADTVRPRLEAAGADLTRVVAFSVRDAAGPRAMTLPDDLSALEEAVHRARAALVVIDPLMAHLSARYDGHRDQDVRRVLAGVTAMAERTGAAVLVVRHLNKGASSLAMYRGGGSIGIIAAARSGLIVGRDPSDDGKRVLAVVKSNLAEAVTSLSYTIEQAAIESAAGQISTSRVRWLGQTSLRANDLMEGGQEPRDQSGAGAEAVAFLRAVLDEQDLPAKEVKAAAADAGIASRTLDRAKQAIGVRAVKLGQPGSDGQQWAWHLPKNADAAEERRG